MFRAKAKTFSLKCPYSTLFKHYLNSNVAPMAPLGRFYSHLSILSCGFFSTQFTVFFYNFFIFSCFGRFFAHDWCGWRRFLATFRPPSLILASFRPSVTLFPAVQRSHKGRRADAKRLAKDLQRLAGALQRLCRDSQGLAGALQRDAEIIQRGGWAYRPCF